MLDQNVLALIPLLNVLGRTCLTGVRTGEAFIKVLAELQKKNSENQKLVNNKEHKDHKAREITCRSE